jgi:hypothetical protein
MKFSNLDLEKLKENYKEIQNLYNFPDFEEINKDFFIERIAQFNTEILIREISRYVLEKLVSYMRLIELIFQPTNAPMYIFSIIKCLDANGKEELLRIYDDFVKIELDYFEIDTNYDEKEDAEFLKRTFKIWNKNKKKLSKIFSFIKKNWNEESPLNIKSYFN